MTTKKELSTSTFQPQMTWVWKISDLVRSKYPEGLPINVEFQPELIHCYTINNGPPVLSKTVYLKPEKPKEVPAVAVNGTAMVIEDELQVRQLAARMLLKLGFTVLEAGDGAEGVEIFKAHPGEIRCVICDLSMPKGPRLFWEYPIGVRVIPRFLWQTL